MRFLMVGRLENAPSTFRQGKSQHHRRGGPWVNPAESLVSGFPLSGGTDSSHHCTPNAHQALPSPSADAARQGSLPPPGACRQPRESRKAWSIAILQHIPNLFIHSSTWVFKETFNCTRSKGLGSVFLHNPSPLREVISFPPDDNMLGC